MRCLTLAFLFGLLLPAVARPDDVAGLRERVLAAAARDPADLKKFHIHTIQARGTSKLASEPVPATFELAAVYPGQLKATWTFGAGAAKNSITICGSNDKGWKQGGGTVPIDMSFEELNDLRSDAYAIWVSTLITLKDADTKLSSAGTKTVMGKPVTGLVVSRRPWPDVTLWFDKESYLLRSMTYRSREAGTMLNKEMIYDGHKEVAGLKVPTRQTTRVEGKEVYSWTEMEYAFPDALPVKTFAKP